MECTNCKSELKPHFNFCPNCGNKVYSNVVSFEPGYDPASYPDGFDPKLYGLER